MRRLYVRHVWYSIEAFVPDVQLRIQKSLALYLTEYSSAFSVGDPVDKEMTHKQLNVSKKKKKKGGTFE